MIIAEVSSTIDLARTQEIPKKAVRNQAHEQALIGYAHRELGLPWDLEWNPVNLKQINWMDHFGHADREDRQFQQAVLFLRGQKGISILLVDPKISRRYRNPLRQLNYTAVVLTDEGVLNKISSTSTRDIFANVKTHIGKVDKDQTWLAFILKQDYKKIEQRRQRSKEKKEVFDNSQVIKKIQVIIPKIKEQVEADIVGFIQTMIKNGAYDKAKAKLQLLSKLERLNVHDVVDRALSATAYYLFPDQSGNISRQYGNFHINREGYITLLDKLSKNDIQAWRTFLAFFKKIMLTYLG